MHSDITILVLGGYGGTGRLLCRYLLEQTAVNVIIAGRNLQKANDLCEYLKQDHDPKRVSARYADASDTESLRQAFRGIDLVLVAATTTKWARQIAETALLAGVDYLDIYFQQDVYPELKKLSRQIEQARRCFITQAGFHPGLPAAFIRHGANYFDEYERAIIAFAMNVKIEKPESVYELIDLIADYKADIYKDGNWRLATYRDTISIDFGQLFGIRKCMPMDMIETRVMPEWFGLKETGVFTTGFNWFVDYVLFPVMMLTQIIKKGSLRHFWAQALVWGMNKFSDSTEGIVFLLDAEGIKRGERRKVTMRSEHASAYDFTVIPVVACIKQYMDGSIRKPAGLWMMGHLVNTDRLLKDMGQMGVRFEIYKNGGKLC
jgi:saccharopine dehydrogenase (NAD+, L-lysine-forming)